MKKKEKIIGEVVPVKKSVLERKARFENTLESIPEGELYFVMSDKIGAIAFTAAKKARFSVSKIPLPLPMDDFSRKSLLKSLSETIDVFYASLASAGKKPSMISMALERQKEEEMKAITQHG